MGKQQKSCQQHCFKKFTWLHYDIETGSVLCFLCVRAEKKGYVTGELSKEQAYISKGFKSWKKAPKCFKKHEQSKKHSTAKTYEILVPRCADVGDMLSEVKQKHKFTHVDYQLELLTLMSNQVLRAILIPIKENGIYSLMSNEWTDIANLERLSICVRTVNGNLEVFERFLGFYEIPNIRREVIVTAIKDALIQMQLPLSSCRGQTYDRASNMLGKKSGVAAKILNEVP